MKAQVLKYTFTANTLQAVCGIILLNSRSTVYAGKNTDIPL
jgi:hypothetical protein